MEAKGLLQDGSDSFELPAGQVEAKGASEDAKGPSVQEMKKKKNTNKSSNRLMFM